MTLAVLAVLGLVAAPAEAAPLPDTCSGLRLPIGASLTPAQIAGRDAVDCALTGRTVRWGATGVVVPEPGHGVSAFGLTPHGEDRLDVQVATDGTVQVSSVGTPFATGTHPGTTTHTGTTTGTATEGGTITPVGSSAPAMTTDTDCTNTYQPALARLRRVSPDDFFLTPGTPPAGVTGADLAAAATAAAQNLDSNRNDCGVPDDQTVTLVEAGTTTTATQIGADGTCGAQLRDGRQTVGFQPLNGFLGMACTWWIGTSITDWDVAVSDSTWWWVSGPTCPRDDAYHLETILTHELGHVMGFGDEYAADNTTLLMYGYFSPCEVRNRLARGEATALNVAY